MIATQLIGKSSQASNDFLQELRFKNPELYKIEVLQSSWPILNDLQKMAISSVIKLIHLLHPLESVRSDSEYECRYRTIPGDRAEWGTYLDAVLTIWLGPPKFSISDIVAHLHAPDLIAASTRILKKVQYLESDKLSKLHEAILNLTDSDTKKTLYTLINLVHFYSCLHGSQVKESREYANYFSIVLDRFKDALMIPTPRKVVTREICAANILGVYFFSFGISSTSHRMYFDDFFHWRGRQKTNHSNYPFINISPNVLLFKSNFLCNLIELSFKESIILRRGIYAMLEPFSYHENDSKLGRPVRILNGPDAFTEDLAILTEDRLSPIYLHENRYLLVGNDIRDNPRIKKDSPNNLVFSKKSMEKIFAIYGRAYRKTLKTYGHLISTTSTNPP